MDKKEHKAACAIQAGFRSYMVRKNMASETHYTSPQSSGSKGKRSPYKNEEQRKEESVIASFSDYEKLRTILLQIMSDNESKSDKLLQTWRKYMGETSIHGLKYICEDKTKPMERAFWIVAVFLSLIMAITSVHGVSAGVTLRVGHWPYCKIYIALADHIPLGR